MKTLKCDLCEATAKGGTFEEWMNNLMPHYSEVHADVMKGHANMPKEDMEAMKKKWMDENRARFDVA